VVKVLQERKLMSLQRIATKKKIAAPLAEERAATIQFPV
jgi:hypothetical protein